MFVITSNQNFCWIECLCLWDQLQQFPQILCCCYMSLLSHVSGINISSWWWHLNALTAFYIYLFIYYYFFLEPKMVPFRYLEIPICQVFMLSRYNYFLYYNCCCYKCVCITLTWKHTVFLYFLSFDGSSSSYHQFWIYIYLFIFCLGFNFS